MCPRRCRCRDGPGGADGTRGSRRVWAGLAPFNLQISGVSVLFFAPIPVRSLGTGPGLSGGERGPRALLGERSRSRRIQGAGAAQGIPGDQIPVDSQRGRLGSPCMGVGAEPEHSRLDPCSAAHPSAACSCPVRAFPGSQLIPKDSCSLCESGCRPGPDPGQGELWDAEGIFPQGSHPGPCSGLAGVSPEWDPGWVSIEPASSISAGMLGNGRSGHGDKMGENLRVWVILDRSVPPEPLLLPSLVLRWLGVSSQLT